MRGTLSCPGRGVELLLLPTLAFPVSVSSARLCVPHALPQLASRAVRALRSCPYPPHWQCRLHVDAANLAPASS